MKFHVITLFPKMFDSPFAESIIARAKTKGIIDIKTYDMRCWAWNSYGAVDDKPYGGGVGMLIRADVIYNALEEIAKENSYRFTAGGKTKFTDTDGKRQARVILTSAMGKLFKQAKAESWSRLDDLVIICGHYEGFDHRISEMMVDEEISIGDYVLTGGEPAAMVMIDSCSRLIKGVLGKDDSSVQESHSRQEVDGKKIRVIEYPQYTRPKEFLGKEVPEVLLTGDPKKIGEWQNGKIKKA